MIFIVVVMLMFVVIWNVSLDVNHIEVDFAWCRLCSGDLRREMRSDRLGAFHAAHKPD